MRARTLLIALLFVTSAPVFAQASGTNGKPAATGMGLAFPNAANISNHAGWDVYPFEQDGIRYVQVNGTDGTVRAAIGYIGDTFIVLPVGTDVSRVSIPGRTVSIPAGATRSVVFHSAEIELALYSNGSELVWSASRPTTP